VQQRELVLHEVRPRLDVRERQAVLLVIGLVQPAPTPTSIRPPLISSIVVTSFTKLPGWRNVTGLTSAPREIREVSRARPAITAHASVVAWSDEPGKLA
jgi:hypothetical protein